MSLARLFGIKKKSAAPAAQKASGKGGDKRPSAVPAATPAPKSLAPEMLLHFDDRTLLRVAKGSDRA